MKMPKTLNKFYFEIKGKEYEIFVLRDDLIGGEFNGNKARKLEYFLNADFSGFKRLFSYGSAQSNAMLALSVFAKMKNLEFYYKAHHISSFLAQNPCGNFALALKNKMRLIDYTLSDDKTLFIPEGVACKEAEIGFKTQANLIKKLGKDFDIFLPSGTGASATFLAKNIDLRVFTTPVVGGVEYLKEQIYALDPASKVIVLPPAIKAHFGELKFEFYKIWHELKKASNITFELLYDPPGFLCLFENIKAFSKPILYIHQGGLSGLSSQLARYERKFGKEAIFS